MGAISYLRDRLANIASGMGTSIDRRTHAAWIFMPMTPEQAEAAYRTSWLVRKIVDIPAKDMTRTWRDWQAKAKQIEALEKEERRLCLRLKIQRAVVLSRLFGGGAIILGTDQDPTTPLDVERIGKGGLKYLHVLAPHQLGQGAIIMDPADPWFGKPSYFQLNANAQFGIQLHPSRVITILGQRAPEGCFHHNGNAFWGDPIMQSIGDAVQNADTAQAGFAGLIEEARNDVLKIPDLMDLSATEAGEKQVLDRLSLAATAKSTWRATILDAEEECDQRQVNWAGMPDMLRTYLEVVAGAADIPVTRLLGQSPKGLQSNGDGEERDYHSKVRADQDEILRPALEEIDELLIRSALGARDEDIHFAWAPLVEPTDKEAAALEKQVAETLKIYSDTAMLADEAITEIAKNRMIESGFWPGCEAAFEAHPEPDDEPEADPNDPAAAAQLRTRAENVAEMAKGGKITKDQATLLMADARPRSLYVQRKLVNADEFLAWAKDQGFGETLTADDLHVTILYSRRPVDWLKAESAWNQDEKGQLVVPPGGARMIEKLGDKGAVVLLFNSSALAWRHEELKRSTGASHDFDSYQPHVTITYQGQDLDLEAMEPYRGQLVFGPEFFEEVDTDWTPKGGQPEGNAPFDLGDRWDPNQPRAPKGTREGGRWQSQGISIASAAEAGAFAQRAQQGAVGGQLDIGKMPADAASRLQDATGIETAGKAITLDGSMVRHIFKEHGNADRERARGQLAVNAGDVARSARYLKAATDFRAGTPPVSKRGHRRFVAVHTARGIEYTIVAEARRRRIVIFSMWKRPRA